MFSAALAATCAKSELSLQIQGRSDFNPSAFPWKNIKQKKEKKIQIKKKKLKTFLNGNILRKVYLQFQI